MRWAVLAAVVLCGIEPMPPAGAQATVEILVQTSLTAGLSHHEAKAVWEQMKAGDPLTLVREPDNPHDPNAVRVDWSGHKLGYIPRADKEAIARQFDRGNKLEARITRIGQYRNHRRKLQVEVYVRL
jgi:hypothetical protein